MSKSTIFNPGDKVRIKDRSSRKFPTGYPLAGAEGTVMAAFYPWQLVFLDVDGYVPVKIEKSPTPLGLGDSFLLRQEDLELILG
jgi:hypothetical protein